MLPDRVSNPGPLTYESGALPIALCSPANGICNSQEDYHFNLLLRLGCLFWGIMLKVQTQFRLHKMRHLLRVYTAGLCKFSENENIYKKSLKIEIDSSK